MQYAVMAEMGGFAHCYEPNLLDDPGMSGVLRVTVELDAPAVVKAAQVERIGSANTLSDAVVECIRASALALQDVPGTEPIKVVFDLDFQIAAPKVPPGTHP